jgi:hypothetical protein
LEGEINLRELVGTFIVFTALNFVGWWSFGLDLTTEDKIKCSLGLEVFILAISIGAYLLGS